MTTPQPPAGPPRSRRRGVLGWARAHKGAAAAAAAVAGVAGIALWKRHQNAAAASGSTADTTGASGSSVQGTYDSTAQDTYNALEGQISALQDQIAQSSTNAASSGTTAGAPAGATVTVPKVTGLQVSAALTALSAAGLTGHVGARNPADTYIVNSQTPGPGARVAAGSGVDLGIAPHRFGK